MRVGLAAAWYCPSAPAVLRSRAPDNSSALGVARLRLRNWINSGVAAATAELADGRGGWGAKI